MVGTGKLSGTAGGGVPRESLAYPISMLCATGGDDWDGDAASDMSETVSKDNSTQNAQPTLVWGCHRNHSYRYSGHVGVWATRAIGQGRSFWGGRPVSIKVVIVSRLGAHNTDFSVFLCRTSGGDPSSRLDRGFPVTANIKRST